MELKLTVSALIICLLSFWFYNIVFEKTHTTIIIGVLSSRRNFNFRNAIRISLNHQIKLLNIEKTAFYFIVGMKDCVFPLKDRLYKYSCTKWNVHHKDVKYTEVLSLTIAKVWPNTSCIPTVARTYSFEVGKLDIRIRKLGILSSALTVNEPIFVILTDEITKEVYAKVKFLIDYENQTQTYLYLPVEEYIYPPNFKGRLTIIGQTSTNITLCNHNVAWDTAGNLIHFKSPNIVAIPAIGFLIHNSTKLKDHINQEPERINEWKNKSALINSQLIKEQKKYNDLVLVDTIDVYSNLPQKIIKFAKWLAVTRSFDYFLKTDDDCILNIEEIQKNLPTLEKSEKNKLWWGNFRKEWPVNRIGKWADSDYLPNLYPWFACGSGNILSQQLVLWLAKNHEDLHQFQGEDVSLGIWLSGLNPEFIDDEKWSCDSQCTRKSYVRAQLSLEDFERADKLLKECGSICHCS